MLLTVCLRFVSKLISTLNSSSSFLKVPCFSVWQNAIPCMLRVARNKIAQLFVVRSIYFLVGLASVAPFPFFDPRGTSRFPSKIPTDMSQTLFFSSQRDLRAAYHVISLVATCNCVVSRKHPHGRVWVVALFAVVCMRVLLRALISVHEEESEFV